MIGFDIGTYSLKAVELQKKADSFTLTNFKVQKRLQQESLLVGVKKFFEEAKFHSKELSISVSGPLALVRLLELPLISDSELKNAVRFEVERFISFDIADAILDYQVVAKNPETKKITVLLAAVKGDLVKNYIEIISKAGFAVKAVDIDGIAVTNAFLNAYPEKGKETYDKAFAVLNIGDATLNVSVVYKGIPFVLRDINGTGKDISEAITKGLAVDKEEAYKIKHNPPPDKRKTLDDLMKPTFNRFAREIELSMGYFENQFSKSVETLYLSGGSSKLFGLKEFISESLEVPVETWDPLASIVTGEDIPAKSLEDVKQELAVAAGLAIRDD